MSKTLILEQIEILTPHILKLSNLSTSQVISYLDCIQIFPIKVQVFYVYNKGAVKYLAAAQHMQPPFLLKQPVCVIFRLHFNPFLF